MIYKEEAYSIIGACYEVYNELGCGFLEDVYQEALEREFKERKIQAVAQPSLELFYKGSKLHKSYVPDFIAYSKIIIELKAAKNLDDVHRAQVHNYLKATGFQLGLLLNFGKSGEFEFERIVRTKQKEKIR